MAGVPQNPHQGAEPANEPSNAHEGAAVAANGVKTEQPVVGASMACTARLTPENELKNLVVNGIQYDVLGFLGSGGYSTCYTVAATADPEERAACKITMKSPETLKLVKSEIELFKKCSHHENIVQFIASYENEIFSAIVMELCFNSSNTTLSELLWEEGFVNFDDLICFMRQIIKGVEFIHQNNVIHRDLKTCNILVNKFNILKICDFEFAVDVNAPAEKLRAFCGTIPYMAPQIVNHMGAQEQNRIYGRSR